MLFLLAGAALAIHVGGTFVSTGLLSERFAIFPDQKEKFLSSLEKTLTLAFGKRVMVLVPLFDFSKAEVIILANKKGLSINKVYSCHSGLSDPCGSCISCNERSAAMQVLNKQNEGGK
jgi:7-cyano-7-deazaguanine synthase